jgi:hypothetical protein
MDDISYEILSHGHYFIEDNILWYTYKDRHFQKLQKSQTVTKYTVEYTFSIEISWY